MNASKFIVRFLIALGGALSLSFCIHLYLRFYLGLKIFGDLLLPAYIFNFVIACAILFLLFTFRERLKFQVGFLFMGGSLLKFALFFVFFYPKFVADGIIDSSEFAAFFVPYLIALAADTFFASKMLAILEREDSSK
jgi:hypothetical protein